MTRHDASFVFTVSSLALAASLGVSCAANKPDAQPQARAEIGRIETANVGEIPKLSLAGDVYLSGQPSSADLGVLKAAGVRSVMNLRHSNEPIGFDEGARVSELGMEYLHEPFAGSSELNDGVFDRCRALLESAPRPLLVHCGSANRVGAVWIPWRVLDGGVPLEQAVAEAKQIGLRSPELEAKARKYVEARKP